MAARLLSVAGLVEQLPDLGFERAGKAWALRRSTLALAVAERPAKFSPSEQDLAVSIASPGVPAGHPNTWNIVAEHFQASAAGRRSRFYDVTLELDVEQARRDFVDTTALIRASADLEHFVADVISGRFVFGVSPPSDPMAPIIGGYELAAAYGLDSARREVLDMAIRLRRRRKYRKQVEFWARLQEVDLPPLPRWFLS